MGSTSAGAQLRRLAIDALRVDENFNPRRAGEAARLAELAASIRQHGVLQTIFAAPAPEDNTYTVVAGHRRLQEFAKFVEIIVLPGWSTRQLDPHTPAQSSVLRSCQPGHRSGIR